jgi:curved DNA-binding protein CbpA
LAQEFTDFYEILEISPNAQPETIHRVYRLLAQSYHPDNQETGDAARFSTVLEAYRTLSDPERRAAYDVEHQAMRGRRWKIFDQSSAMQGIAAEKRKRIGILSLLYTKRMSSPDQPNLNLFELEQLLGVPREHLELSLWYLKESGRIQRGDSGRYAITYKGVETIEESADQGESRLLLPEPIQMPAASDAKDDGRLRPV